MDARYHHRHRSGEAEFSATRRSGGRVGCVPQEAEPEEAPGLRGVSVSMHRCDGGVRECAPLGPRDREARSRGEAGPAGLRQAVRSAAEERRGRRGGDLRGGLAADDALQRSRAGARGAAAAGGRTAASASG